ncbi:MAG TPA: hypothetical protein VH413_14815 [Verrucomicrobiae bacterium]|jgi:hypothetical protein|nr:hypothetical protein [Verrucomicrobiae bacterium]
MYFTSERNGWDHLSPALSPASGGEGEEFFSRFIGIVRERLALVEFLHEAFREASSEIKNLKLKCKIWNVRLKLGVNTLRPSGVGERVGLPKFPHATPQTSYWYSPLKKMGGTTSPRPSPPQAAEREKNFLQGLARAATHAIVGHVRLGLATFNHVWSRPVGWIAFAGVRMPYRRRGGAALPSEAVIRYAPENSLCFF